MSFTARKVEYFYVTVNRQVDEAHELLDELAGMGVNFAGLTAVPAGPESTQLTLFPDDAIQLQAVAKRTGLSLTGPQTAILIQGDDEAGALSQIHKRLRNESIDVYASNAIADGKGRYGCVLYVRKEDADRAIRALAR